MVKWEKDEGYSCCKTARFGEIAVVIVPPDWPSDGWGYQAFDESDEDAMRCGERYSEDYGFASEQAVVEYVESCMT